MASVDVCVRIKPTTNGPAAVHPSEEGVVLQTRVGDYCVLDGFGSIVGGSDQQKAYAAVAAPLVDRMLEGYSCTLMAYGQTGSGKTHTIFGPPGVLTEAALRADGSDGQYGASSAPAVWGLFPRIALELLASGRGTLHASAVEVYQERAYDLLAERQQLSVGAQKTGRQDGSNGKKLAETKDPNAAARAEGKFKPRAKTSTASFAQLSKSKSDDEAFVTVGEKRVLLAAPADVARLARTIEHTRTAVGHNLNARSSRSHCLVHLHLTEKIDGSITKRQFLVVDLAGSERILRSGAEGVAAAQAMAINTSLTALGKVVRAVGAKASHVPYRDSTLTQLLRSSLAGKACTSVVIAVASEGSYTDESKCSLEFGQRMQAVKTRAAVVVGGEQTADHEAEDTARLLEEAKQKLAEYEASGYGERFGAAAQPGEKRAFQENTTRLAEYEREIRHLSADLAELAADTTRTPAQKREEARSMSSTLREMSAEVSNLKDVLKRQKAIPGFYVPPRAIYTRKEADIRALENKLETLTEVATPDAGARVDMRRPYVEVEAEADDAMAAAPPATAVDTWTAHVNIANGKTYYHNAATGESTYTAPEGLEAPLSPPQIY